MDRLAFLVFGAIVCSLIIAITTHRFAKRGDADRVNRIDFAIGAAMVLKLRGADRPDTARPLNVAG